MQATVERFIARWLTSSGAERANKDSFLRDLCDALDLPHPDPTTGDPERDQYVFEKDAVRAGPGGATTIGKIDLYKAGCFILEAKQGSVHGAAKVGTAKRNTPAWHQAMHDAKGQAIGYSACFDAPPPFLIVCDIGECIDLYSCFDGTGVYHPFPKGENYRIWLKDLAEHVPTLRAVFLDPLSLDPSRHALRVTTLVAEKLAQLAKALDDDHAPELVAKFLMRCLFTMFAEDIGLLPDKIFTKAIKDFWIPSPPSFTGGIEGLWRAMNEGTAFGFVGKLLKFNGGLFRGPSAIALNKKQLQLLLEAAECDWSDVEPSIFGTLLERALDRKERHALGAHFTPRAYVERLVRPAIEEPLRAEWQLVQAEVRSLVAQADALGAAATPRGARRKGTLSPAEKKLEAAASVVRRFLKRLAGIRILDPACGTGNFLYVSLDLLKRLESEVLDLLASLGVSGKLELAGVRVNPSQFYGIEIKPWAKEIAELVLWIGYLQWQTRASGSKTLSTKIDEPVLRDYGNIECRDAILAYDHRDLLRDEKGKPVSRWDGETRMKHPVTGDLIPDDRFKSPIFTYTNPRRAAWPAADFIVGNPPFIGNKRMRKALGDGYVEAVRAAYDDLPQTIDFVMYWWHKAASLLGARAIQGFGFITTKSIGQSFNGQVLSSALGDHPDMRIAFAIPNHPWVDTADGAAVRIAMTVVDNAHGPGNLGAVTAEVTSADALPTVHLEHKRGTIRSDLTLAARLPESVVPLLSNRDLCLQGCKLVQARGGPGFSLTPTERARLLDGRPELAKFLPRYFTGNDLTKAPAERYVVDFFGLGEEEARREFPAGYQLLLDRVKPFRDQNPREIRRTKWWLFGENAPKLRRATASLSRFIATSEVAEHRAFVFLPMPGTLADGSLAAIPHDDAFVLAVLSSRPHVVWAVARGGRMGKGNQPRYQNGPCFAPFPFPQCDPDAVARLRALGEALDAHRKARQLEHPTLTITGMYGVLARLRATEHVLLTPKEREIHEHGLVSVLRKIHDDIDAAVLDAYQWPRDTSDAELLTLLVALNAERAEEERRGLVRWLRPEFQSPKGVGAHQGELEVAGTDDNIGGEHVPLMSPPKLKWPSRLPEQVAAVRDLVAARPGRWTCEQVAQAFGVAKLATVEPVLDALAALGVLSAAQTGDSRVWFSGRG